MDDQKHSTGRRFIWLFGENKGSTRNNNSYYAWRYMVEFDDNDGIEKYLILEKSPEAIKFKNSLPDHLSRRVIWRNSLRHYRLYKQSDMLFVTLSYLDVVPDHLLGKERNFHAQSPVVYLQHGVLGMKKIGYGPHSHNNNFFRFIYYNRNIPTALVKENSLKPYQLTYGEYMPRYSELVRKWRESQLVNTDRKSILWFLTWREYKRNSIQEKLLLAQLKQVLLSERLAEHLRNSNSYLRVVVHQFFAERLYEAIKTLNLPAQIEIMPSAKINVLEELASADRLITDYSSVAFDFAFLQKPVALFQPDLHDYMKTRSFYCTKKQLEEINVANANDLISLIIKDDFSLPPFFRSAFPETIDYTGIENGEYIDRLYRYFKDIQNNAITFLGYGFWGIGGTVTATKSLAESLTEKGYAVRLLSLKRLKRGLPANPPAGVRFSAFYLSAKTKAVTERAKRFLFKSRKYFQPIKRDPNLSNLIPYTGWAIQHYLDTSNARVVVSSRESFHEALYSSKGTYEKIFFFHCAAKVLETFFPGITSDLRSIQFDKALFTTASNMMELRKAGLGFSSPLVIGNTLESRNMLYLDDCLSLRQAKLNKRVKDNMIHDTKKHCVTLLRLGKSRELDVRNIIEFGMFLANNNRNDIQIKVYGSGELLDSFIDSVFENGLQEIIKPMGATTNPAQVIRGNDLLIDFTEEQSFGMTYLEAIFNGVVPLCRSNLGSVEILEGHEYLFYDSWMDLLRKIDLYYNFEDDQFVKLYSDIDARYSHHVVADKFLDLALGGDPLSVWDKDFPTVPE